MTSMAAPLSRSRQCGASLIEVMVTIVILSVGLLGMAGLQSRLQQSEMEAYQRSQALLLLDDMANRLASNRNSAASYITASGPVGTGTVCTSIANDDLAEWCNALQGAAERVGTNRVGAMLGGRGCVETVAANTYLITVAWQGLLPIAAPPAGVACGANSYDGGTNCTDDMCRRVVTTIVRIADL